MFVDTRDVVIPATTGLEFSAILERFTFPPDVSLDLHPLSPGLKRLSLIKLLPKFCAL